MKRRKAIVAFSATLFILLGGGSCYVKEKFNKNPLKQELWQMQLGVEMTDPSYYIRGSAYDYTDMSFDFSSVFWNQEGKYPARLTYRGEVEVFQIEIVDTIVPEATIMNDVVINVDSPLYASDLLCTLVESSNHITADFRDKQGLKVLETRKTVIDKVVLQESGVKYAKAGVYQNALTLTDRTGNCREIPFTVTVRQ